MTRISRQKSCTGTYHVMMRGINHLNIFLDDEDKDKFLRFLYGAVTHKTNISGRVAGRFNVYAYALMGNHFHLLVNVEDGELGEFVKKIAAGYVRYFNKKYDRDGHLFKERFKSEPCENFDYFCVLMGYIHQNPIKHGFAKRLDDYRYTSWHEYSRPYRDSHCICDVETVLSKMSLEEIKECIADMLPDNLKCIDIDKARGQISDQCIIDYIRNKHGFEAPSGIRSLGKEERNAILSDLLTFGGAVRQLSRLTGVVPMAISRLKALQNILSPL